MQCKYFYDIEKIPCTGLRRLEEAGSAHEPELLHRVHREPREEQLRQPEDAAETVELRQAGVLQRQEPQEGPRRRGGTSFILESQVLRPSPTVLHGTGRWCCMTLQSDGLDLIYKQWASGGMNHESTTDPTKLRRMNRKMT